MRIVSLSLYHPGTWIVIYQVGKVGIGPVTDLKLTIGLDSPVLSQRLVSNVVLRRNKVGDQWRQGVSERILVSWGMVGRAGYWMSPRLGTVGCSGWFFIVYWLPTPLNSQLLFLNNRKSHFSMIHWYIGKCLTIRWEEGLGVKVERAFICSFCWFPWCQYFGDSWFQALSVSHWTRCW